MDFESRRKEFFNASATEPIFSEEVVDLKSRKKELAKGQRRKPYKPMKIGRPGNFRLNMVEIQYKHAWALIRGDYFKWFQNSKHPSSNVKFEGEAAEWAANYKDHLKEGVELLELAAAAGKPEAQYDLVQIYRKGEYGIPKDLVRAYYWEREYNHSVELLSRTFNSPIKNFYMDSIYRLGWMFIKGNWVFLKEFRDILPRMGFKLLEGLAREGNLQAQRDLARMYYKGKYLSKDFERAAYWKEKYKETVQRCF